MRSTSFKKFHNLKLLRQVFSDLRFPCIILIPSDQVSLHKSEKALNLL